MIDGVGFPCVILKRNVDGTVNVQFEDGFVEDEVPMEEINTSVAQETPKNNKKKPKLTHKLSFRVKDDDGEACTVIAAEDETAFVIDDAENNVAAGTGIRGIRWLRTRDVK